MRLFNQLLRTENQGTHTNEKKKDFLQYAFYLPYGLVVC